MVVYLLLEQAFLVFALSVGKRLALNTNVMFRCGVETATSSILF